MSGTGGAKRLDASRLTSFEDGDDDLTNILAARRPRTKADSPTGSNPAAAPADDRENSAPPDRGAGGTKTPAKKTPAKRARSKAAKTATTPQTQPPAPQQAPRQPTVPAQSATTPATEPEVATPTDPAGQPSAETQSAAPRTSGDVRRPTVVQIPARLREAFLAHRQTAGLTNDQVIITALETHHQELHNNLEVGGGLFAARRSQIRREEAIWPVNVVFFEADYTVLDELVARTGFPSRARLISAALDLYLNDDSGETT